MKHLHEALPNPTGAQSQRRREPRRLQQLGDTFRPAASRQDSEPLFRIEAPDRDDLPLLAQPGGVCPACGAPPALRIAQRLAEHAGADEPDEPIATYRCQRRRCGCTYLLLARHCRRAGRESLPPP